MDIMNLKNPVSQDTLEYPKSFFTKSRRCGRA